MGIGRRAWGFGEARPAIWAARAASPRAPAAPRFSRARHPRKERRTTLPSRPPAALVPFMSLHVAGGEGGAWTSPSYILFPCVRAGIIFFFFFLPLLPPPASCSHLPLRVDSGTGEEGLCDVCVLTDNPGKPPQTISPLPPYLLLPPCARGSRSSAPILRPRLCRGQHSEISPPPQVCPFSAGSPPVGEP